MSETTNVRQSCYTEVPAYGDDLDGDGSGAINIDTPLRKQDGNKPPVEASNYAPARYDGRIYGAIDYRNEDC